MSPAGMEQSPSSAGSGRGRPSPFDDPYEVSSLTGAERAAWAGLTAVSVALEAEFEGELHREAGLTPFEFHLLYQLGAAKDGEISMSQVAHIVDASLSRLSHVVRRLERHRWLRRRASPDDARVTLLRLDDEGRRRLGLAMPVYERIVRRVLTDRLGEQDLAELTRLCVTLLAGLKEDHWVVWALRDRGDEAAPGIDGPPAQA